MVGLEVVAFDVEPDSLCDYDYLTVNVAFSDLASARAGCWAAGPYRIRLYARGCFIVFTDLVNVIEKKIRPIYALWCLRAMSG